jgi:formylglycine-generating enzyme required for sulfatase activity
MDSFYISSTEVSNVQYREFINELKSKNDSNTYRMAFVDSTNWEEINSYMEPFKMHYFNHPAYNYYPCVCISYEGAMAYCSWLTKKINESQEEHIVEVKLPNADQWEYAARGGIQLAAYSWGGWKLQNKNGFALCNYQNIEPSSIHYNNVNNQYEIIRMGNYFDITAPILSYVPNAYGLYNTCGNVAEMIDSKGIARGGSWNDPGYDVRISSEKKYDSSSAEIGFRPMMIVRKK